MKYKVKKMTLKVQNYDKIIIMRLKKVQIAFYLIYPLFYKDIPLFPGSPGQNYDIKVIMKKITLKL